MLWSLDSGLVILGIGVSGLSNNETIDGGKNAVALILRESGVFGCASSCQSQRAPLCTLWNYNDRLTVLPDQPRSRTGPLSRALSSLTDPVVRLRPIPDARVPAHANSTRSFLRRKVATKACSDGAKQIFLAASGGNRMPPKFQWSAPAAFNIRGGNDTARQVSVGSTRFQSRLCPTRSSAESLCRTYAVLLLGFFYKSLIICGLYWDRTSGPRRVKRK